MEETKTTVTETKQEDKGLSQIQPNERNPGGALLSSGSAP